MVGRVVFDVDGNISRIEGNGYYSYITMERRKNRMNLFQRGNFTLNSGAKSQWKLECDALTDEDVETLALMIRDVVAASMTGGFGKVFGVPRGGLRLEKALQKYCDPENQVTLIVDDVLTTGGSMARFADKLANEGKVTHFTGAVVFARGEPLPWVNALFQMPESLWVLPTAMTKWKG